MANNPRKRIINLINNGYSLKNVPLNFQDDKEIIETSVLKDSENLRYVKNIKNLPNNILYTAFRKGDSINLYKKEILHKEQLEDPILGLIYLYHLSRENKHSLYLELPEALQNSYEFNKNAIEVDSKFYSFLPLTYKCNLEICKKMVRLNCLNFNKLLDNVKKNFYVRVEAIANNYAIYSSLLGNYQTSDKNILRAVIEKTGSLEKIPSYERSVDLIIYALKIDKDNIKYVSENLRNKILEAFS